MIPMKETIADDLVRLLAKGSNTMVKEYKERVVVTAGWDDNFQIAVGGKKFKVRVSEE